LRDTSVEQGLNPTTTESREHERPQATISTAQLNGESLDVSALETWLWDAACSIRGATDAPKFKDFILPLIFFKRLSDVFDDEFAQYSVKFGSEEAAREIIEADHLDALKTGHTAIVRFYIPVDYQWNAIRNHPADGSLGEFVTGCMRHVAHLNPDLRGVLDVRDYNERQGGQRTLDDDRLAELIQVVNRHRLGLKDTEPDMLGRAYEYLLRKFAEGQGQSAGEFYTPKEVGWLIAHLINPEPHTTIYDPACGSAGLLIKARLVYKAEHPDEKSAAPKLFGQELNPTTFAMAKMNMFLHDFRDSSFSIGDTFRNPGFVTRGSELRRFDYVVANPMWNQDGYDDSFYDTDSWNRFTYGTPPKSSADWGWIQHMLASLNDHGTAAIVLDTGAVSRGSDSKSSNKEREVRKALVESDFIEAVLLLPENLFYNTTAASIIILLNRTKPAEHREQILLVNASAFFVKEKPKNVLTDGGIGAISDVYRRWKTQEKLSQVVSLQEVRAADYNLSPSRFVDINDEVEHRPLSEITADLAAARLAREHADAELSHILSELKILKKHL
jgi:type I restriction enzyme M protein